MCPLGIPVPPSKDIKYLSTLAKAHSWPGQEAYDNIDFDELEEDNPRAPDGPVFSITSDDVIKAHKKQKKKRVIKNGH
jgi:hypothetical protein